MPIKIKIVKLFKKLLFIVKLFKKLLFIVYIKKKEYIIS